MATQIVMPQLGESVAEGVIGKWLKQEGDSIAKDEPIVEVVTDKVNAEIPSPVAGTLTKISAEEGATVLVGQEIAVIGGAGESVVQESAAGSATGGTQRTAPGPQSAGGVRPPESTSTPQLTVPPPTTPAAPAMTVPEPQISPPDQNGSDGSRRVVRSSPLVQRLAEEHNVDLSQVPGTGIGGRVSKKDIQQFVDGQTQRGPSVPPPATPTAAPTATPTPSVSPAPTPSAAGASQPAGPDEEYLPISPVRRMIAEHMVKSKFTLPHATSMIEVDMTPVVRFRAANKDEWQRSQGIPLSFMAFVAMATVESLRRFPLVNSEWAGDKIILKKNINLGLAVAAQNGLIVPNIKHADRQSLGGLAHAVNDLSVRARTGKLTPGDVAGGTFTLNNTGAIGSVWSVSIINYPQAAILSADAIVKRVRVMDDDSIAIRHMMNLCISFDHRTLDGATVSEFLQFIRKRLETWPADAAL